MEFVDFIEQRTSPDLSLFFPGWEPGETVAFLSPHDDDVLLGAAYLLLAVLENGGRPLVLVFCSGDAGYSSIRNKAIIVEQRKRETLEAYGQLGLGQENILFFDIPDFSVMTRISRILPSGRGLIEEQVRIFRQEKVSRVVFSSGYFEHWDHTAVHLMGMYTSPQAGDPVLAGLGGQPFPPRSYYVYSVWADFEPSPTQPEAIRAEKGILVSAEVEDRVRRAIQAFASQSRIFTHIVNYREKRRSEFGYLELYKQALVRAQTDFKPYHALLKKLKS